MLGAAGGLRGFFRLSNFFDIWHYSFHLQMVVNLAPEPAG